VQDYNTYIRQFPVNLTAMMFHYATKPNFTVENEAQIQQAPNVDFNTAPPAAPGATAPAPQAQPPVQAPAPQPAPGH
jgi:LemA protein